MRRRWGGGCRGVVVLDQEELARRIAPCPSPARSPRLLRSFCLSFRHEMAANNSSNKRARTAEAAEAPVPGSTSPRFCSSDGDLVLVSSERFCARGST